jgi:lipopolysaccharide export system protein LptA
MTARALAVAMVLAVGLGSVAGPGEAQTPAPKRRPAKEAATPGQPPAGSRSTSPGLGMLQGDRSGPVTVDADQLEAMQKQGLVVFTGNVIAAQNGATHYADRLEVYLNPKGTGVSRMISTGNVRVVTRDCLLGTAGRAEYHDAEQRVILVGNARVWRDNDMVTGERITIYLAEDRSVVEGGKQERVKAVFNPRGATEGKPKVPGPPCS